MKSSPCRTRAAALFLLVAPIFLIGTSNPAFAAPQSPINLPTTLAPEPMLDPILFVYPDARAGLVAKNEGPGNREKSIKIEQWDPADRLYVGGFQYRLTEMHFHTHSEHFRNEQPYAMEIHLVHKRVVTPPPQGPPPPDVNLAVGLWVQFGAENEPLKQLFENLPTTLNGTYAMPAFNLKGLLPPEHMRRTWRYHGSLTTPHAGSSTDVYWIVMDTPITMSPAQVQRFRDIWPETGNFRMIQPTTPAHLLRTDVPEPGTLGGRDPDGFVRDAPNSTTIVGSLGQFREKDSNLHNRDQSPVSCHLNDP